MMMILGDGADRHCKCRQKGKQDCSSHGFLSVFAGCC
jgi:hypothetical protein